MDFEVCFSTTGGGAEYTLFVTRVDQLGCQKKRKTISIHFQ